MKAAFFLFPVCCCAVSYTHLGDKEPVEGTSELFVLKFKARRDVKFQPKLTDGMVVDKKLNTRKLYF